MTCEEYLDQQERQALRALTQATRATGEAVEQAVDLEGHVRRRPVLALSLSALAGFVAVGFVRTNGGRVTRGALQAAWSPLVRPTLSALGSLLAKALLGAAEQSQEQ